MREQKPYLCRYLSRMPRRVDWRDWLFGKGEDKCLQATHKVATISTNKSGGTAFEKSVRRLFHRSLQTSFKPKDVSCVTDCGFNLTPFALNLLPRRRQILRT